MKRTYNKRYATRDPRASVAKAARSIYTNRRLVAIGVVVVLLLLFVLSCFLVVSDARIGSASATTLKTFAGAQGQAPPKPSPYAQAAVLMDADSGRVLYQKNAHEKLPVASTTKMITALVARKKLGLADQVKISQAAAAVGEQGIWLTPGETLSVEDLLYALLVQSANDAAYALAEKTSGNIAAFVSEMNKEAASIGATDSQFKNPHGLDEAGHYSSALDLALIGRQLLKDPVLAEMARTRKHEIPWAGHPGGRIAYSHNEFLLQYSGATGIKTGYTARAGWCLVGSETRNGKTFIAVVLNSQHRAADVSQMVSYGFAATQEVVFLQPGQVVGQTRVSNFPRRYVKVVTGGRVATSSVKGAGDNFTLKVTIDRKAKSPVKKGRVLGRVECYLNGSLLLTDKVAAASTVSSSGPIAALAVFIWYALCWMGKIIFAPFRIF